MRTELETQDIERIANKVIEKLLPIIQGQQLKKNFIAIDQGIKKEKKDITRERKPRMLSVRESAGYLGIAEKTLRNKLGPRADNPFPVKPKHIGGRVLFDMKDINTYLDGLPTT